MVARRSGIGNPYHHLQIHSNCATSCIMSLALSRCCPAQGSLFQKPHEHAHHSANVADVTSRTCQPVVPRTFLDSGQRTRSLSTQSV
jgi:hypothetical protein